MGHARGRRLDPPAARRHHGAERPHGPRGHRDEPGPRGPLVDGLLRRHGRHRLRRRARRHGDRHGTGRDPRRHAVAAGSTHEYRIRARDAAGNVSGDSAAATATTPPPAGGGGTATFPHRRTRASRSATLRQLRRLDGHARGRGERPGRPALPAVLPVGPLRHGHEREAAALLAQRHRERTAGLLDRLGLGRDGDHLGEPPAPAGAGRDDKGAIGTGVWTEWDVTPLVTGNGEASLMLAGTSSDGVDFHSREAPNPPQLVVTTQ